MAVEGTVKEAAWSSTGKVMRIDFAEAADSKFMAAAFLKARPTLDAAFGGDVTKAVSGKRIRVTGKLQEYKGRPEIMIDKPEQLVILPDASTKPAEDAKPAGPKK